MVTVIVHKFVYSTKP